MLCLIGLGLNEKGYSREAYEIVSKADKVYIENYTVEFPYDFKELEREFKKDLIPANRDLVESSKLIEEAKENDVVLLIYGSPLMATTHISLVEEAKKKNISVKIIHGGSVFDSVAETGLQLYKFGKIASMPNFKADSYVKIVQDNQNINAHTLILIDIGMEFKDALKKLDEDCKNKVKLEKIIICSKLGTETKKIIYKKIGNLNKIKTINPPFCFIIPGKLHFIEEEVLTSFEN
ncbi:MAG: diphthine synthase [Candidatus Pacearchaeota archaeon]